ncbi:MAG: 30S ribosome-binding factor RbfA [Deltaproteobacteria bacterium]|nr:30S ribosome-binding factor RbfA [Deltaproteobacteria bacterium]
MTYQRSHRIGDQIQKEISGLLAKGLKDPRIGFVTITGVEVTPDLHLARVYYTVMGDKDARTQTEIGLKKATPFIRRELGRRMRIRYIPDLLFIFDTTLDHSEHINRLLKEAASGSTDDSEDSETH